MKQRKLPKDKLSTRWIQVFTEIAREHSDLIEDTKYFVVIKQEDTEDLIIMKENVPIDHEEKLSRESKRSLEKYLNENYKGFIKVKCERKGFTRVAYYIVKLETNLPKKTKKDGTRSTKKSSSKRRNVKGVRTSSRNSRRRN